jgi:hypothetical protein
LAPRQTSVSEEPEESTPEFKPGWPDILPMGMFIARSLVTQRERDDTAGDEDDDDHQLSWLIGAGVSDEAPRFAFLGDLTIRTARAFGGVTVVLPFALRHETDDMGEEDADRLLLQYGEWASSLMYDHAAMALRGALAGNGLPLTVPYGTPQAELQPRGTDDSTDDREAEE